MGRVLAQRDGATDQVNRRAPRKPITKMTKAELAAETAELDAEFVADTCGPPSPQARQR